MDLVKIGEVDAVDAKDLLGIVLSQNLAKVKQENGARDSILWYEHDTKKIRNRYYTKASKCMNKIWKSCRKHASGHNYRNIDVRGSTHRLCDVCGHTELPAKPGWDDIGSEKKGRYKAAVNMNETVIKALRDRMIELDRNAGKLDWPIDPRETK